MPMDVTPQQNGMPVSNLIWNPAIAAVSPTSAAIAVSYGSIDGFTVGVQRIDGTGNPQEFFLFR